MSILGENARYLALNKRGLQKTLCSSEFRVSFIFVTVQGTDKQVLHKCMYDNKAQKRQGSGDVIPFIIQKEKRAE
jgi:hypothetical protein